MPPLPPEVIEAAEVGSGWSGRMVPLLAFLGGVDELSGLGLESFEPLLRYGVAVNFSPKAWYEVEALSLCDQIRQQGQSGKGGGEGPNPVPKLLGQGKGEETEQPTSTTREMSDGRSRGSKGSPIPPEIARRVKRILTQRLRRGRERELSWTQYTGPKGGHGWKNDKGEVLYQAEAPRDTDTHDGSSTGVDRVADSKASRILSAIGKLPSKVVKQARGQVTATYTKLEGRYGKGYARAIVAAGVAGLPVPLPGASVVMAAPLLAVAELHRRIRGTPQPANVDPAVVKQGSSWFLGRNFGKIRGALNLSDGPVHAPKGGITIGGIKFVGGEFIPKGVLANATAVDRQQLEQPKADEKPQEKPEEPKSENHFWDGVIDSRRVERERGDTEYLTTWNFVDNDGDAFPQNVIVRHGLYDPDPDHPDSAFVDVWRWETSQEGGGGEEHGPWTTDENEARKGGEEYAAENDMDERPAKDDADEDEGEEDDASDRVRIEPMAKGRWDSLGISRDIWEVHGLFGVPSDADVTVSTGKNDTVVVTVRHPKIEGTMTRTIGREDDGNLYVHNDYFKLKDEHRNDGTGFDIFSAQAEACKEAGFSYIETHAAKGGDFVGYYVWPLFGYNMDIDELDDDEIEAIRDVFPEADSVRDVMDVESVDLPPSEFAAVKAELERIDRKLGKTPRNRTSITGTEWWLVNGVALENAVFDLNGDSRSFDVMNAYRLKKKSRR